MATVEYAVHFDDPQARVDYVQEKLKLLMATSWVNVLNFIIDMYGTLPQSLLQRITKKSIYSSTYSTQPGPEKCLTTFGATLLEVNYSYGCCPDSCSKQNTIMNRRQLLPLIVILMQMLVFSVWNFYVDIQWKLQNDSVY